MAYDYELFVIGAGSGGVRAARMFGAQGARVAVVEDRYLGGTCVNVGCIPSKSLIRAAATLHHAKAASRFDGIEVRAGLADWRAVQAQKDELVGSMREAKYRNLLNEYDGISYLEGAATLSPGTISVAGAPLVAGKTIVVCGYGWGGQRVSMQARFMGAQVIVTEIDPTRALEAAMEGYRVMSLAEAAPLGDLFLTATGSIGVLRREHFQRMKDGALLANAGNYAHEIDVPALRQLAREQREVRRHVTEYVLRDGRRLHLLAQGALVNIVASDGHPIEIMDLSFSVQALAVHYLAQHADELKPGVVPLPDEIDVAIARTRLELLGVQLEKTTAEQQAYQQSWREP
ncbi:MAG: adenosylhomocysteinase [Acidobacteria bacterium]|nr:adenosylhomocysteinase [Acidobacteriota bacterium]